MITINMLKYIDKVLFTWLKYDKEAELCEKGDKFL